MINFRCRFYPTLNKLRLLYKNQYVNAVREIIDVFCVNKMKNINTLCWNNEELVRRLRKIAKCEWKLRHASVRPNGTTRMPLNEFFMKFDIWVFYIIYRKNGFY